MSYTDGASKTIQTPYAYVSNKFNVLDPLFLRVEGVQAIPDKSTTELKASQNSILLWTGVFETKSQQPTLAKTNPIQNGIVVPVVASSTTAPFSDKVYLYGRPIWNFNKEM